jgi:hypothetical protein
MRTVGDQGIGTRFSTRTTLVYMGMLRCMGPQFGQLAANQCLAAADDETGLARAVLLEFAGRGFHHAAPQSMPRKAVTYLMEAGHAYTASQQRKQAIHCYELARRLAVGQVRAEGREEGQWACCWCYCCCAIAAGSAHQHRCSRKIEL